MAGLIEARIGALIHIFMGHRAAKMGLKLLGLLFSDSLERLIEVLWIFGCAHFLRHFLEALVALCVTDFDLGLRVWLFGHGPPQIVFCLGNLAAVENARLLTICRTR